MDRWHQRNLTNSGICEDEQIFDGTPMEYSRMSGGEEGVGVLVKCEREEKLTVRRRYEKFNKIKEIKAPAR